MSGQSKSNQGRHEERKEAFYLLFEQIFQKQSIDVIIEEAIDARDAAVGSYTKRLAKGVEENCGQLDELIGSKLKGWTISRISKVSLSIMRIAVYEMLYEKEVPVSVSINEAVELAKEFATPDDASYVNGVLGAVAKSLESSGEK